MSCFESEKKGEQEMEDVNWILQHRAWFEVHLHKLSEAE